MRAYLGVADCWLCGTTILLSELSPPASAAGRAAPGPARTPIRRPHMPRPATPAAPPVPPAAPAPPAPRHRAAVASYGSGGWLSPWLVSLIVHLILITLLGLIRFPDAEGPTIVLSAAVARDRAPGDEPIRLADAPDAAFDLPVPNVDLDRPEVREMVVRADQEARKLRVVDATDSFARPLQEVRSQVQQPRTGRDMILSRDPRLRAEIVKREGGTTLTEAAVARGLGWLERHQAENGSWSLGEFRRDAGCRCGDAGRTDNREVATALALLPFLGAGQTHLNGYFKPTVSRGLRWLIAQQLDNGDLRGGKSQTPGMYGHGQAALVLCEAYLMTGDESLRQPAQKAVDFIVEAQYTDGGWRYAPAQETSPRARGDTSVFGWQLMALRSAQAAGLEVPPETMEQAAQYLDTVAVDDGARYGYQRGRGVSPSMTAEGLLCRVYLGWGRDRPGLRFGLDWLLENAPPERDAVNIYYWYYATQLFHHYGGPRWDRWNRVMRNRLIEAQETKGHAAGSWRPKAGHDEAGGRLYMTALATCTLEVYYRHLPIFRALELK